jgi:DNA-directed RNA polymerase subunit RPC12/RpoP
MPKFHCIHCGQHIDAPETMSSMHSNCPTCGGAVQVPGEPPYHRPAKTAKQQPGLNRWQYALSFFGILLLLSIARVGSPSDSDNGLGIALLGSLIMVALSASRFRNMGASPWWCLFGLIPLVSIVMYILCFAQRPGCYIKAK